MYIGLFRLSMYIPSQCVDPAHRYLEKSEHVDRVTSDIGLEIQVCKVEEKALSGRAANRYILELQERERANLERYSFSHESYSRFTVLKAKTITRNNPERFSDLYEQMKQMVAASFSEERVFRLVSEITGLNSKTAYRFRTVLAQEALWQVDLLQLLLS